MQCSVRVLSPRRPFTVIRPKLAQFPRQASLTSAINRGIRKTQGGVDSLERRTSARTSRDLGEGSAWSRTWRAGLGDREGGGRPERSFAQRSRDTVRSGDIYRRDPESPNWQSRSDNVRRYDRARGAYSNQRQSEQDDHTPKRTLRSSPFDQSDFGNIHGTGGQFMSAGRVSDGPNRKERRAAIFGKKTRPDSSPSERNETQTKHKDNCKLPDQFSAENLKDERRGGSVGRESPGSFGSNRNANEYRSKPIRRARDGRGSWQEKQQSLDMKSSNSRRRGRRDSENEDRSDVSDEVVRPSRPGQPHVKVPLSVPYTTAGSEFLYGTHVVKAAIQSGRRMLYKLYIYQGENSQSEDVEQDNSIYKLALAAGVKVSKVRGDWERLLNKMSDQRPHNGCVLEASPVPKLPVTSLEKVEGPSKTFDVQLGHQSAEELAINSTFNIHGSLVTLPSVGGTQRFPFLVMLDRIRDPGNLGSIIRSAYFLGAEAIVMIEHGTAPIGPVALKSSASAAEHLPLLIVKNEHAFMRKSQESGWKFFAATSPESPSAGLAGSKPLPLGELIAALQEGPCVLLLGSEEGGIRPQLQRIVNGTVGVESGRGSSQGLDSLNVGVAAALLMQEFLHGSKSPASESKGLSDKGVIQSAPEKVFSI